MDPNRSQVLALPPLAYPELAPIQTMMEFERKFTLSRLRLRLTRVFAACILASLAFGRSYWTTIEHPVLESSLFIIGITLVGIGAAGRAWATSYISGQKMKRLITTGPYSLCRNPLYLFSMILGVGFGFCTETFTMPVLIASVLAVLYYFQIKQEEQHLLRQFGKEYESYRATIPCFFPSHKHYSEPEEISISPRLLKRGLFGIAFLLILIGAFELLAALHQLGVLRVLFRIY